LSSSIGWLGRVSQSQTMRGQGIRRLTGKPPVAFLFANVTRPQDRHVRVLRQGAAPGPLAVKRRSL